MPSSLLFYLEDSLLRKFDFIFALILAFLVAFIVVPTTRESFIAFTSVHPYIGGFGKFVILASMGELLAIRITSGSWTKPVGFIYRALIWGFIGMVIAMVFTIYAGGVTAAMDKGLLPGQGSVLAFAFLTSLIMNLTFGVSLFLFHRMTDTYIDLRYKTPRRTVTFTQVIHTIDWQNFFTFVIGKTLPFFWIPAQTITFMLAPEYRVLMAAGLSLALGLLLSLAKRGSRKQVSHI
jgi:hypothetical protein